MNLQFGASSAGVTGVCVCVFQKWQRVVLAGDLRFVGCHVVFEKMQLYSSLVQPDSSTFYLYYILHIFILFLFMTII